MKRLIVVSFLCCCGISLNAQIVSIVPQRDKVFYVGVDNPIKIFIENQQYQRNYLRAEDIIVKADSGEIFGTGSIRLYRGIKSGIVKLTAFSKKDLKLISGSETSILVKQIPLPTFKIANLSSSYINNKTQRVFLANQLFVRAELEGFWFYVRHNVDSFNVIIVYSKTNSSIKFSNISNRISDEIKAAFGKLENDDLIIFKDIYASGPGLDGSKILSPLILTIKE